MALYLQMDGVDDYIQTPSMTYTIIELDFLPEHINGYEYILDARSVYSGYFLMGTNYGGGVEISGFIISAEIDGNTISILNMDTKNTALSGKRGKYTITANNSVTSSVHFFTRFTRADFLKNDVYSIKFYNNDDLVAHYDMSTGTVQDQSGNGRHATLVGGTWADDGEGGEPEPEPITHTLSLSEIVSLSETMSKKVSRFKTLNDSITTSDAIAKRLSVVIADTIETSETENENTSKSVSDSLTLADNQSKTARKVVSDFIPIDDNISISNSNTRSINLSDSIAILDSITKSLTRSISDSVSLGDTEDETVLKSLVDNITLSDSLSIFGGKSILLTDSISVTDSISTTKQLSRFLNETIALSDAFTKQSAQSITLYDVIVTADEMDVFNPDAPTLIGVIRLKGKRELFVYLKGELNMLTNQNFSMVSGDTKTLEIDINENLTGASVKWAMKKRGAPTITLNKVGSIVDGKIHIILDAEDTEELSGLFVHECEVTDQQGNVSTVTTGSVNILADMI